MSDFIPSLREQIVEATARYERRRPAVRALAVLAPPRGVRAPLSAALAGFVALLAVAALLTLGRPGRHDTTNPPAAQPRVVARLPLADSGGVEAAGFGAVWVQDTGRGQLLRVETRTRRVAARVAIAGAPAIATGAGAVWALSGGVGYTFPGPLLAIDPRTNRVSARIPLPTIAGKRFIGQGVVPVAGAVWVYGPAGAIRVDARSHRVTTSVTVPTSRGFVTGGVSDGRSVWLITGDGRLLRLDPGTGARLARAHTDPRFFLDAADARGVFVNGLRTLAELDPASGSQTWRTTTPGEVQSVILAHGRLWAVMSGPGGGRVISSFDPSTGRRLTTTSLPDFVGTALAATASELWVLGDDGKVDVIRP
jgi:outer membrane protein assembly factor BamB